MLARGSKEGGREFYAVGNFIPANGRDGLHCNEGAG